jgi:hypothetical protein
VPVSAIGVVTRERPAQLLACLDSYLEHCRDHDRSPDFVVTDDSPDLATESPTCRELARLAARFGAAIRYGSRRERDDFARALAHEAAVPLDIVRFGLLGDERCALSIGANRNSWLLDTIDSLVLAVDDDTVCRVGSAGEAERTVVVVSEYDPTEFWFFADRDSALAATAAADVDLLACHEALLGKAVGDPTGDGEGASRVAITMTGLAGDSGMASPRYYFALDGASRERFVASEQAYRTALRSRQVVRTVRRPTISSGSFCMTTFFGVDNRSLVPPFFPVQRNSDGIFGLVLNRCFAGSRTGFLPWTLVHAPTDARAFAVEDVWADAESLRMSDVVIDCVLASGSDGGKGSDAMRISALGERLRQFGSLPLPEFEMLVSNLQRHRAVAFTTLLQQRLHSHGGSPPYWAADVERLIALMTKTAGTGTFTIPRDLPGDRGADETRRLVQELILRYGDLLDAWPALVEAARRLKSKEHRLTRRVTPAR